jgi:ATP-dependent RNA helicase RhlE
MFNKQKFSGGSSRSGAQGQRNSFGGSKPSNRFGNSSNSNSSGGFGGNSSRGGYSSGNSRGGYAGSRGGDSEGNSGRGSYSSGNSRGGYSGSRGGDSEGSTGRGSYNGGGGSRGSYGGSSRGGFNRNSSRRSGRGAVENMPHTKFINKDVIALAKPTESSEKFHDLNINKTVLMNLEKKSFVNPTEIQSKIIPEILAGKDVIGLAKTGTGKTAAFLIPTIEKVLKDKSQKVLIIVPNRELAFQINEEFITLAKGCGIYSTVCVGGTQVRMQINNLRRNDSFIIGTPGRLMDMANRKFLKLENFETVVLDEVDTMLDMGFIHDLTEIVNQLNKKRQSLFFSATMPEKIKGIANRFLVNPVEIKMISESATKSVYQDVVFYKDTQDKYSKLNEILTDNEGKYLVFIETKMGVDRLEDKLIADGFQVSSIHGDKRQSQRLKNLGNFKKNVTNILLATDVASRGIDIKDITHVINFDLPRTYADYTHRIGRTGRYDKTGIAFTFVRR